MNLTLDISIPEKLQEEMKADGFNLNQMLHVSKSDREWNEIILQLNDVDKQNSFVLTKEQAQVLAGFLTSIIK